MAILGIDEVGRGPLAGPLVIGAVILGDPTADWCAKLTDSKQLSPARREEYAAEIEEKALATALGWVSNTEIDHLGMGQALRLATRRAVEGIRRQKVPFTEIIIDGTVNFLSGTSLEKYVTTIKSADSLIKEVSAASIIAKVARDASMVELAQEYPHYGFEKHMGYGTAYHLSAIQQLGPCPLHRASVRPVRESMKREGIRTLSTKQLGDRAESVAAEYLAQSGHQIIARNHKTRFYEIDIISIKDDHIYFTEVKYRKDQSRGSSRAMVDAKKLQQMTFAAEAFLKFQPRLRSAFSPLLAVAAVSGPDFHLDDWFTLD